MLQDIINTFHLNFPFVQRAFIAGILVALCSSLLGVTLVLKRFSFIGDGLSHVAFGAMSISAVLQTFMENLSRNASFSEKGSAFFTLLSDLLQNQMYLVLPITVIAAILLLRTGKNTKIQGDAAVAMISVASLALGYLIMNIFKPSNNLSGDVCTTLFGSYSILTLTPAEVWLCVGLSLTVIAAFIIFYNKIFAVTFDESFAQAVGTHASVYNLVIAIIVAVIIVLAMNLVGSLLISALVIFPALASMRVFKSFKSVTICSVVISVTCALAGLLISVPAGTPVGSTIVAADLLAFISFYIVGKVRS